ncbi:hypothetical protein SLS55_005221 [Diplodia seriata]|uniref:Uncharacterized protein n=1 Tax=Diplodia seriata TaxID=420778 RepID=A0ABR3CFS0_9PEZI
MARATRNSKAAPALSSPPARRTRSKLKEKDAASSSNNPTSSSSQPVQDAPPTTDLAPPAAQKAQTTKKSTGKAKSKASAVTEKTSDSTTTAKASSTKASAKNNNNNITSEESDNTASAPKANNKRSRRQPTVDRNTKKVTKSRARKPTTKTTATTRKALEQYAEEEEAPAPPARAGPVRRTRAALKAGIASPLAPVSDNLNLKPRQTRSKKNLKDATPLSIIEDENRRKDPDDWFADVHVQQMPQIYRDPGASMEEISEHEDATTAENDDIMEHDTASSDADEAMGGDVEMVAEETENDASETEEDMADEDMTDEEMERPQTPNEAPQQLQPPTTARSFGLANFFFNPFKSVQKYLSRTPAPEDPQSPLAMSPESPTVASPSNAAQQRRTRDRNARYTPREKNADKRHELSQKKQEPPSVERLQAQLREKDRELAEMRRKSELDELKKLKEKKEAEQVPGRKRRRSSPTVIPARRPGEKGSFGMLDEYFDYDEPTPDSNNSRAKRRRTTIASPDDDDTDDEYDFVQLPMEHTPPTPSLKRPRNGYRMAAMKDGQEDPMVANHELRVMHQENSFSKSLSPDSLTHWSPAKTSPQTKKSSPSAVYTGSFLAVPGDPGYKPENVFKKSEQQLQQQSSPKKDGKMDSAELKARAEEIVRKEKNGEDITEDERELLEKAQRKFGHIAGSGSFSAPEYDSDDSSIVSDDLEESTSPQRDAPVSSPPSAKASSTQASAAQDSAIEPTKSDSMKPPPPPMPAHAQLPQSVSVTNDNAISKMPPTVPGTTPKVGHSAALARQRELAEKHKPKTGSRLQYVSGVSSSPGASSPIAANNMESSLITQGMSTPAGNVGADSFSFYDALVEEAREKCGSLEDALNSEEKKYLSWLMETEVENESKDFAEYAHEYEKAVAQAGSFPGTGNEDDNERKERDEKEFAEYERAMKELRGF